MKTLILFTFAALLGGCAADGTVDYEAVDHITRTGLETYDRARHPEAYRPSYVPPVVYPNGQPIPYPTP